jgi:UDP-3-O-[3-hydroxymyristoyl] glucosamine N-acyltransferase
MWQLRCRQEIHNVILGADTAIAAGVTIGGSAILGKRCQIGGGQ